MTALEMGVEDRVPAFVRDGHIADTVVLSTGLPGCGKTMMSPIISALARVEMMRFTYGIEHVCLLGQLGAMTLDAAAAYIRIHTDLELYNLMMGRETNFRPSDLSSVWKDSSPLRYVRRLFQPGDGAAAARVPAERPILHLVTHSTMCMCRPLFAALGERLRIVDVVRHPNYMIKQWYKWMPRAGTDPRMFGLCVAHAGQSLPWFATGWEDLYLRSNTMDRTIYSIRLQWRMARDQQAKLTTQERAQVIVVPFEQFVVNPEPFMSKIAGSLDASVTDVTRREMKRQKVPRQMWADGIGLPIYKHYGWEPPAKGSNERTELARRRAFVAAEATPDALAVWDELCDEYEADYLLDQLTPRSAQAV